MGKILVGGWHSELGVEPLPQPLGNSHPDSAGAEVGVEMNSGVFGVFQRWSGIVRQPRLMSGTHHCRHVT